MPTEESKKTFIGDFKAFRALLDYKSVVLPQWRAAEIVLQYGKKWI